MNERNLVMPRSAGKDIEEIFGYAPDDTAPIVRTTWALKACPFVGKGCIKYNHDRSICYGTCSVSNRDAKGFKETVIICPNRFYADNYAAIRNVAEDAFGRGYTFYTYPEYVQNLLTADRCVVALGHDSGREVRLGRSMSMDWVIARIENNTLIEYAGIEIQSIDITGNYRDNWHAYNQLPGHPTDHIPSSQHALNWANVHKRLIPQLIRKGLVYSRSAFVKRGLYFVLPDRVYCEFEKVIGPLPPPKFTDNTMITVFTYDLGGSVSSGKHRPLTLARSLRFSLSDFSEQFIAGVDLPSGEMLDARIRDMLNVK